MIRIINVNYSNGTKEKVAVIVSEQNDSQLHSTLMRVVQAVDQWASVEYLETYKVPAVQLDGHSIAAIWHVDELIKNL